MSIKFKPSVIFILTLVILILGLLIVYQQELVLSLFSLDKKVPFNNVQDAAISNTEESSLSRETESTFEKLAEPEQIAPKQLKLERLGIAAKIYPVGRDEANIMETPESWEYLGWYIGSSRIGAEGNIIINGHYDDNKGRPAVFWQLKNAVAGDTVSLVDEYGRFHDYTIVEIYYVDIDSPDRFQVFESPEGQKTLTLITCGGVWLPGNSTYNKRLIVRAAFSD